MKKTENFVSSFRLKTALCCSVAVLLAACGGGADDLGSQQSLAAVTAGAPMEAASAGTTGAVGAGPEAPKAIAQEIASPDSATQANDGGIAATAPAAAPMPGGDGLAGAEPANPAASSAPATGNRAPVSSEFNLSGYQDAPAASSSDAAIRGATAAAGADGQQAPQLPAA